MLLTDSASGLDANVMFDKSGILSANVGMPGSLDINGLFSSLGLPSFPIDTSAILSISSPFYRMTSRRANASMLAGRVPLGPWLSG